MTQATGHSHPVTSVGVYVAIYVALVVCTILTYTVAKIDLGFANVAVALAIAVTKASLVVLFFMGVRHNTPLTRVVAIAGFAWLLIMFGLGMSDYLTRPWMGVPGR